MPNQLDITSKEISCLAAMDELFQNYCKDSGIALDFTKSKEYSAYVDRETANAFVWFLRGCMRAIGDDYLKKLV